LTLDELEIDYRIIPNTFNPQMVNTTVKKLTSIRAQHHSISYGPGFSSHFMQPIEKQLQQTQIYAHFWSLKVQI